MDFHVVEECDIEVVEEAKNDGNSDRNSDGNHHEDMYIVQTFEAYEANEKREICVIHIIIHNKNGYIVIMINIICCM